MGSVRTYTTTSTTTSRGFSVVRVADVFAGSLLLVLALPLITGLAMAVRFSSNGPVLRRQRTRNRRGRPVEMLSFRTTIDGASTEHHERMRAIVGAAHKSGTTKVGRLIQLTHTERLPQLLNVVRGDSSLFAR